MDLLLIIKSEGGSVDVWISFLLCLISPLSDDMAEYRGRGAYLAVLAGVFATGGSLLGKLAGVDASSLVSWRQIC